MRTYIYVLLLFSAFVRSASGQKELDPRLQRMYSHLVGSWVGQTENHSKQPVESLPLRVDIKQEDRKKRLRLDYYYGVKGTKQFEHSVRFFKIIPEKSTVIFSWSDGDDEPYSTKHLDEVLSTGYGEFAIYRVDLIDGKKFVYLAVFNLSDGKFSYLWHMSSDGKTYTDAAHVSLSRIDP